MILKQDLIPIQDDPENVKRRCVPRPDANTYAEGRSVDRERMQEFLKGSEAIEFQGQNRAEI